MTMDSSKTLREAVDLVMDLAQRLMRGEIIGQTPYAAECAVAMEAVTSALQQPAAEPADMRAVCEALGFDPENHHNAAKCPYCAPIPEPATTDVEREEIERELNKVLRLQVDTLIGEIVTLVPQGYDGWDYHGRHWTDRIAKRAADQIKALFASKLFAENAKKSDGSTSQPQANGPLPILTDGQHSDGEA